MALERPDGIGGGLNRPDGLHEVAEQAFRALGLCLAPDQQDWEPQYCTTNTVFATRTLVFKQYKRRRAFLVESQILAGRDRFTFDVPEIVFSLDDPRLGCWNVFSRMQGVTIAEAVPDAMFRNTVVDKMIDALAEFEALAQTLDDVEWVHWSWASAIEPLAMFCSDNGAERAADTLRRETRHWDGQWEGKPKVPCFDLYSRNVLWSIADGRVIVGFVDFDKANRLVPRGEQLSHLAMMPGMRGALKRGRDRYRALTGIDPAQLNEIVVVSCVCRALAGVRDSLPWSLRSNPLSDPHASLRRGVLEYALRQTRMRLSMAVRTIPDHKRGLSALHQSLTDVAKLARLGE